MNPLDNIRRGELKRILLYQGASKVEVHNMVEDIMAERFRWTAVALGRRMNLTFALKIKRRDQDNRRDRSDQDDDAALFPGAKARARS